MEIIVLICLGIIFWNYVTHNHYKFMSDTHAAISVTLALLTVANILPDHYVFAFSTSYFMVDLVEVISTYDLPYFIHHVLSIIVPICGVLDPVTTIGTNAGAHIILIEFSSLFLNNWKRNRKSKNAYLSLLVVYFFNRVAYLTYLLHFSFISKPSNVFGYLTLYSLRALHLLMCVWYYKLCLKYKKFC